MACEESSGGGGASVETVDRGSQPRLPPTLWSHTLTPTPTALLGQGLPPRPTGLSSSCESALVENAAWCSGLAYPLAGPAAPVLWPFPAGLCYTQNLLRGPSGLTHTAELAKKQIRLYLATPTCRWLLHLQGQPHSTPALARSGHLPGLGWPISYL